VPVLRVKQAFQGKKAACFETYYSKIRQIISVRLQNSKKIQWTIPVRAQAEVLFISCKFLFEV